MIFFRKWKFCPVPILRFEHTILLSFQFKLDHQNSIKLQS